MLVCKFIGFSATQRRIMIHNVALEWGYGNFKSGFFKTIYEDHNTFLVFASASIEQAKSGKKLNPAHVRMRTLLATRSKMRLHERLRNLSPIDLARFCAILFHEELGRAYKMPPLLRAIDYEI